MEKRLDATVVWEAMNQNIFAVLGMVTKRGEARTVGITYIIQNQKLYVNSEKTAWKVRHISANRHVSITVPISKRIPLLAFVKIPAATITFSGEATIYEPAELSETIRKRLYRNRANDREMLSKTAVIEVVPNGEFLTYGVGVPMWQMANRKKARGRAQVA